MARTCVVRNPDGTLLERTKAPWHDWLLVAVLAAGAGLVAAATLRDARRTRLLAGAVAVTAIGTVAWFLTPVEALAGSSLAFALAALTLRPRSAAVGKRG